MDVAANHYHAETCIIMLLCVPAKTFQSYANDVFVHFVTSQLQYLDKLDIVWDRYMADILKTETRSKRRKGVRKRVEFLETGKSFSS